MVGDPAQTIYSFAGANAAYLRDFPREVPRHHLDRAGPQLPLDPRGRRRPPTPLLAGVRRAAASSCAPSARRARGAATPPQPDEVAEAEAVAAPDRPAARDGAARLGEVAVLFRINAQSEAFEEALAARGIPYVVRGAARFFDRPEVRQAVTLLRGAARVGGERRRVPRDRARHAVRHGLDRRGADHPRPDPRPLGVLQALVDQADEFAGDPGATLGDFVADLDRRAAEQHAPVADGVTLATFHAAKGLEWDAVFLCGLQDGTLPITYADTPAAIEEERRLLYVGMTRARARPRAVSWAPARNPGGRGVPQALPLPRRRCCPTSARADREPRPATARWPAAASAASRC